MHKKQKTNFFTPSRLVYHLGGGVDHEQPMSSRTKAEQEVLARLKEWDEDMARETRDDLAALHDDVEETKDDPVLAEAVKRNPALAGSRETLRSQWAPYSGFDQNPELMCTRQHMDDFFAKKTEDNTGIHRFLSTPNQMKYSVITLFGEEKELSPDKRKDLLTQKQNLYLREHRSEIQQTYERDIRWYQEQVPAIQKVPLVVCRIRERDELRPEVGEILLAGGEVARRVAAEDATFSEKDENGNPRSRYLEGWEDPVSADKSCDAIESLNGKTVILSFEPQMFQQYSFEELEKATISLVEKLNGKGARIVMSTPPKLDAVEDARKKYLNDVIAPMFRAGKIHSVCDVGSAFERQLRNLKNGDRLEHVYFNNPEDQSEGYTGLGIRVAANGLIDACNGANRKYSGATTGCYERHFYGTEDTYGLPEEKEGKEDIYERESERSAIELIPEYDKPSIANLPKLDPEGFEARESIYAMQYITQCLVLEPSACPKDFVMKEIKRAEENIGRLKNPESKKVATETFLGQKANIYYHYVWREARLGKNSNPGKILELIEETRKNNKEFLAKPVEGAHLRLRLQLVERSTKRRQRESA